MWFVFSILGEGNLDGWTKIKALKQCNLGFSIFLSVVQNFIYLIDCVLGIYCILRVTKLYGEDPFLSESLPNHTEDNGSHSQIDQ